MKQYRYVIDYDCNLTEMIGSIRAKETGRNKVVVNKIT